MPREHRAVSGGFSARWREVLRDGLSRALLGAGVRARFHQQSETLQAVQKQLSDLASALHPDKPAADLEPLLAWIRGAEAHLAALQADHEHLRELHRRQTAQLDRVTARAAALEARTENLERMDTEIVLSIARSRATEQTR